MKKAWLIAVVLMCGTVVADEATLKTEPREWKSADGNFAVTAKLIGFSAEGLKLEKADGKVTSVPIEKLSSDDRTYAIEKYGKWLDRPSLGMGFQNLKDLKKKLLEDRDNEETMAIARSLPDRAGLIVTSVTAEGPGQLGGVQFLDILTHVQNTPVRDQQTLQQAMIGVVGRDSISVRVQRRAVKGKAVTWQPETLTIRPIPRSEAAKRERQAKEREKQAGPLRILAGGIGKNALKNPTAILKLRNASDRDVIAYTVDVECYNNFDEPVKGLDGSHVFRGISQDRLMRGDEDTAEWSLDFQRTTTKIVAHVSRVKFADGEEWNVKDDEAKKSTFRVQD